MTEENTGKDERYAVKIDYSAANSVKAKYVSRSLDEYAELFGEKDIQSSSDWRIKRIFTRLAAGYLSSPSILFPITLYKGDMLDPVIEDLAYIEVRPLAITPYKDKQDKTIGAVVEARVSFSLGDYDAPLDPVYKLAVDDLLAYESIEYGKAWGVSVGVDVPENVADAINNIADNEVCKISSWFDDLVKVRLNSGQENKEEK